MNKFVKKSFKKPFYTNRKSYKPLKYPTKFVKKVLKKTETGNVHWPETSCWAGSRTMNYKEERWQCKCGKFSSESKESVMKSWDKLVELTKKNKALLKEGKLDFKMVGNGGIEPPTLAPKARVLPVN